jgi:glycogen debranching enzyme
MGNNSLRQQIINCILELSTEEGINASGKDEVYGCIFGRDSAITILKILRVHSKKPELELLEICRRALLTLVKLQGKEINIESGEAPGKFIHEFRKDKYNHLLGLKNPWYVYPDGILRNYDSIDSTPLTLIALYKYYQITGDNEFLVSVLPAVEAGLDWLFTYGDIDKDYLLEYDFPLIRKYGGLRVQSWTDSHESLRAKGGQMPKYPIAPVEVQGYAWLALKLWADFYRDALPKFSQKLTERAKRVKWQFNRKFIYKDGEKYFAAQALDGNKDQITTVTGNTLLCFWATYQNGDYNESIVEDKYAADLISRSFENDLFDQEAGIRTMSTQAATFNPNQDSYHNGSFWPVLNGMIHEGLETWGFMEQADQLKLATINAIEYFNSPIELFIKTDEGKFVEYKNSSGQVSCKTQAWSAAVALDLLT